MQTIAYVDECTEEHIKDGDVWEISIKHLESGETTVSHISGETRDNLIESSEDIQRIFLHD